MLEINIDPQIYEWLKHPLLLIIVSALISSFLIPLLTRRWQDHQKELEIKVNLVGKISESVTVMLMAIQFAEVGAKSQTQEDFDRAYREWETKAAAIGSYIEAYYPKMNIGFEWENYSEIVSDIYILTGVVDEIKRREILQKLQEYFARTIYIDDMKDISPSWLRIGKLKQLWMIRISFSAYEINWESLAKRENPEYNRNWNLLKNNIKDRKNEFVWHIIRSHIL